MSRWGGYPGRDFFKIGTLVVRMMGSSLLVVGEGDGGGLLVMPQERALDPQRCVDRFGAVGGGIGGVFGGGGDVVLVVVVTGTMAVVPEMLVSGLLSLWLTASTVASHASDSSALAARRE